MKMIFGIIYVIIALLTIASFFFIESTILFFPSLYLIIKGLASAIVKKNPLPILDVLSGFYLLFLLTGFFQHIVVTILVIVFLLEKGIAYVIAGR